MTRIPEAEDNDRISDMFMAELRKFKYPRWEVLLPELFALNDDPSFDPIHFLNASSFTSPYFREWAEMIPEQVKMDDFDPNPWGKWKNHHLLCHICLMCVTGYYSFKWLVLRMEERKRAGFSYEDDWDYEAGDWYAKPSRGSQSMSEESKFPSDVGIVDDGWLD